MNPLSPRQRYNAAHEKHFAREYPQAYASGHYSPPVYPKVATSNGMQTYILNLLNWSGHRCTRINVSGRLIMQPEKQASGISLQTKKYMHSATRKGTADLSATIKGRSVMLEIKAGNDRPREAQLLEQARERAAGGVYEFIYSVEEFLIFYDNFLTLH